MYADFIEAMKALEVIVEAVMASISPPSFDTLKLSCDGFLPLMSPLVLNHSEALAPSPGVSFVSSME